MLQITPQMRVIVAVAPIDFRCGIDGLARVCKTNLSADPFRGTVFVFRNRRSTAVKILAYDGQGFWLCQKRLSQGKFRWWPSSPQEPITQLEAHQLHVLLSAGDPSSTQAAPQWRAVCPAA
jgi:transposase